MLDQAHYYFLLLLLASGVSAYTASLIWKHRSTPGAYAVLSFTLGMCAWALPYAAYWFTPPAPTRLFWLDATYFGVVVVPGAFFAFTLYYTGRQTLIHGRRLLLLTVEPALTLLLLWTDPWHGLFFAGKQAADSATILDGGPWFWLHVVYSYGLLLISAVWLFQALVRAQWVFRWQAALVLFAGLLPLISNIITFAGLNPLPGLDLTPLSFTLTGLILTYSLYQTGLLDLVPVARGQVVDQMSSGFLVIDRQQRIVDANAAALKLLSELKGTQIDHLIGKPIQTVLVDWHRWVASGPTPNVILDGIANNAKHFTLRVAISPLLDEHQRCQGQVVVLSDITEEKRMERELRQSLNYFQAIFDASTDAIFICDAHTGVIRDTNARASALYLYSREEMVGSRDLNQFNTGIEPFTTKHALQWFEKARTEGPQVFEWMGRDKNNQLMWLDMHIQYTRLGDNDLLLVRASDMTERKHAQQQEFELRLERERVNILTHFMRDASHEFRTPLSVIRTSLYLMSRTDDAARRQAKVEQIELAVNHMVRLIDMLVVLASLDSGIELQRQAVNVNQLVNQVLITARLTAKPLHWDVHLAPALELTQVDPDHLLEALRQLLDNAVRFTPDGGRITVTTKQHGEELVIEVGDTGCGIAEEDLPHIFYRFFRTDDAHTSSGFGLGLPIAKRIIELHGGTLSVTSQVGVGSVFRIELPTVTPVPAV
ncbi:MAG: PAS domain S-box protein [Chloroflexi bacterium]|uniref:histidine kinase N-terminal 7TM domain-containing protein n=1 Tax=Candidatus Flexifilum breve TaxID=3140694 RepID=UPI0031351E13|nr:PAS domain S-box protein [Chloroflexota bacterium]